MFIALMILSILLFYREIIQKNSFMNKILYDILKDTKYQKTDKLYIVRETKNLPHHSEYKEFTVLNIRLRSKYGKMYNMDDIVHQVIELYSYTVMNKRLDIRRLLIDICLREGKLTSQRYSNTYIKDLHNGSIL